MYIARDIELLKLRDSFKHIASKQKLSNGPDSVGERNQMMADVLQELICSRKQNGQLNPMFLEDY